MEPGVAVKRAGALLGVVAVAGALFLATTISSTGPHQQQDTLIVMRQIQSSILTYAVKHRCMPMTFTTLAEVGVDAWGRPLLLLVPENSPDGDYALLSLGEDGTVGGSDADADIVTWAAMPGSVAPAPCEHTGIGSPSPR